MKATFDSTIPSGEPELMRASHFRRHLPKQGGAQASGVVSPDLASLSPSLMADLQRFELGSQQSELLEVLAACVRHAQPVTLHLQCGERAVPLTVFPRERLVHCPAPTDLLVTAPKRELQVLHIEPALLSPPQDAGARQMHKGTAAVDDSCFRPLGLLLWELALLGGRDALLPEIAGPAVYRVSHGLELVEVTLPSVLLSAVYRLRREPCHLRDIATWPGLDRERAVRLLNALYLQSGLIVSRSHPDAMRDSWFSALGR
jgi:hypothetical protein